ncbi:putative DNA double-strand break repair Rad50 ATPase [compost metagenome]
MALSLSDLEVTNFMSIKESRANLRNRGLVLVVGDNQDDDTFESNGAGKSSFFSESIVWALYGQTIRGVKADEVINRVVGKGTRVRTELVDDLTGDVYEIIRHRKHPQHGNHVLVLRNGENITGKSDTDTNQIIEELVGMDYMTFTNSIMFGQGVTKLFASATDSEQKKILEQMLQIDVFRVAQELAKAKESQLSSEILTLDSSIEKTLSLKASLEKQVEELQTKEEELGEKVALRIKELDKELDSYYKELESLPLKDELVEEEEQCKALLTSTTLKLDKYKEAEENLSELLSLQKSAQREIKRLESIIKEDEERLYGLSKGLGIPETCEVCGQPLPLDDTSHLQGHLEKAIKENRSRLNLEQEDLNEFASLISKANKQMENKKAIETSIQEVKLVLAEIRRDIKELETNRSRLETNIRKTKDLIKEQSDLLDTTYSGVIEDNLTKIREASDQMEQLRRDKEVKASEHDKYKFWVNSFGNQGIKSVMLDSVTPFLNERCNYYLTKLAGNSIEVTFSTQQKIKSGVNKGQMKDKFEVVVDNKNGDANYRGNSGGEKRRVDIAINMALQDLVLSRTNKKFDLIVYDECFEGLDSVGCENVIQLLNEKAKQCGTVLVITHNDNLKQLFSKSMKMVKTGGTTIVKEDAV